MNFDHRDREFGASELEEHKPAVNAPRIVLALIVVFVLVQLCRTVLSKDDQDWFTLAFAFTPARYAPPADLVGYMFPGGKAGDIWTFVSHMFLHGDWVHLIVNSVWMLIFGSVVARRLGSVRFLVFSAICAAIGAAAHLAAYLGYFSILVGASGAISGQMAGAVRLMFANHGRFSDLNRSGISNIPFLSLKQTFMDRRAVTFIVVWMAVNFMFGMIGFGASGDIARIAWEAHVGGFAGGLLLFGWFARGSVR